jgi:MYXO-CTERM domain-containing protein
MKSIVLAVLSAAAFTAGASAAVTFSGSGNNPEVSGNAAGSAEFSISGNTLTVTLTNTTAPRTTAQGNALTGVAFDLIGSSPSLVLTNVALGSGAFLWGNETSNSAPANINGSWTSVLGASPLAAYGAASSGFAGRFNGGSISLGNSGPNYGIVAADTFDGSNVSFGGSQFPFVQTSLVLTFTGVSGISEGQIGNVSILFGTDGTGVIQTPTPGAIAPLMLAGLAALRRRRA